MSRACTLPAPPTAGGSASFSATRRSVYFHSSMRRCGSPSAAKAPIAALRASAIARPPGSWPATASKLRDSACSALVLVAATVMKRLQSAGNPRLASSVLSGGLALELGVAAFLQFQRQLLAARLLDAALRHHVHPIGHDVVQEPLIVGDDEHRPAVGLQL